MRVWIGVLLLSALPCFAQQDSFEPVVKPPETRSVVLQPGDVIGVVICQDAACQHQHGSKTVVIDTNGNIHLPWVHTVKASGLSAPQLQAFLTGRLSSKAKRVIVMPGDGTPIVIGAPQMDTPSPEQPTRKKSA